MSIKIIKSTDVPKGKLLEVNFYITYVNRYFRDGIYEDKILP